MGHQDFLGFLVVDYICYIFLTVREAAIGESYALELFRGAYSEVLQGKVKGVMASDKINLWVAPRLGG